MQHELLEFITYEFYSEDGSTHSKAFYPDGSVYYYRIDWYSTGEYEIVIE